ncbi:hypothetical protein ACSTK0_24875, partial [Vibrio parahaemolyticus]
MANLSLSCDAVNPLSLLRDNLVKESDRWLLWTPVGVAIGIAVYFACPFVPSLFALAASPLLAIAVWKAASRFNLFV